MLISQQVMIITGVARLRCLTLMKLDRICVEHNQSNERLDITIMQLLTPWELYSLYKYTGNVCMDGHCRKSIIYVRVRMFPLRTIHLIDDGDRISGATGSKNQEPNRNH